jgi:hypothetical protein
VQQTKDTWYQNEGLIMPIAISAIRFISKTVSEESEMLELDVKVHQENQNSVIRFDHAAM